MTADIFGQGVQRKVRAVFDRPLKHRPEQRIVARDDRRMPLSLADHLGDAADHRDIDQAVGGICRGSPPRLSALRFAARLTSGTCELAKARSCTSGEL